MCVYVYAAAINKPVKQRGCKKTKKELDGNFLFLTVVKMFPWNVKGTDSERDNECDFEKPAAKRRKKKPLREIFSKNEIALVS